MEATTKLPMWSTVKDSYALAWRFRGEYVKMAYAWFLVLFALQLAHNWYAWPWMQQEMCNIKMPENISPSLISSISSFLLPLLSVFAASSIAVAWHRLLLRDERITTNVYMRADNVVWSYFLFGFYLWIAAIIPSLPLAFLAFKHNQESIFMPLGGIIGFIYFILVMIAFVKLPVMLPAKALSIKNITIKETWIKTGRSFWRLLGGNMLCMLINVPLGIIFSLTQCKSGIEGIVLHTLGEVLPIFLITPITLSFLSLSFRHFFENNTPIPSVN